MKYEIMFIVRPDMEETNLNEVVASFEDVLVTNGAKVLNSKNMGQRELAYEIKKYKRGFYYLYQIEAPVTAINEFDRLALLNEDIIRHMIIKLED
ncbi:MAG: 30S ribosomal protein S6 [Bacilli bacterium]|nr:30S ribosomal protein S6 [Bacilli bacterium]MDD4298694.1 30S ribosomal protein S6 [Bacilli bacterium]MDD4643989.1 30S ribosomal protein S6 [Bacilli bacterium]